MIGKIILAVILLLIIFVIYKMVHACKTGDKGGSIFGRIIAWPCKILYNS